VGVSQKLTFPNRGEGARGQSSVRTIVSADNFSVRTIVSGTFVREEIWKGLNFKIVNLPFILEVHEFKIKRTRKKFNALRKRLFKMAEMSQKTLKMAEKFVPQSRVQNC
jgi:hypothetical protein